VIKAVGKTGDGTPFVILGLTGENVTRLMADEPILFDLAELGMAPCVVTIVGGRTQADIVAQLEQNGLVPPGAMKPIDERAYG